ncbi:MAG: hypothetical protein DWQ34_01740 [Planctomycetota bacterium]|nr:MAG: hypothetical protein DWQ29_04330 [Planctomycetota bacterium]REJ97630.1 MAG: hypothetical protein DWQ34_01740 [Planctomycetota bacterium]REK22174.1 MAG: hypothetical protein DWQ41_19715 [Planctomycetota bacterium]REK35123.1 MAG: hypothetical protein DWQ45_12250 [Planctomycetota bacterium]
MSDSTKPEPSDPDPIQLDRIELYPVEPESIEPDFETDRSARGAMAEAWRSIESPAAWFVLLNFLDLAMTYILITRGSRSGLVVGESNRVAAHFLNHWGLKGLLGFKLVVVLFVCLIAYLIAFTRPGTARGLLGIGTAIVAAVVVYSAWLYVQ